MHIYNIYKYTNMYSGTSQLKEYVARSLANNLDFKMKGTLFKVSLRMYVLKLYLIGISYKHIQDTV